MTSIPALICWRTTSAVAVLKESFRVAVSTGLPSALSYIRLVRSGGRGRLPVWVVRIRSVLRFTQKSPLLNGTLMTHGIVRLVLPAGHPIGFMDCEVQNIAAERLRRNPLHRLGHIQPRACGMTKPSGRGALVAVMQRAPAPLGAAAAAALPWWFRGVPGAACSWRSANSGKCPAGRR